MKEYNAKVTFQGHYNEPQLEIKVPRSAFTNKTCRFEMVFDPFTRKWLAVNIQNVETRESTGSLQFSFGNQAIAAAKMDEKAVPEKKSAPVKATAAAKKTSLKAPAAPEKKERIPSTSVSSAGSSQRTVEKKSAVKI